MGAMPGEEDEALLELPDGAHEQSRPAVNDVDVSFVDLDGLAGDRDKPKGNLEPDTCSRMGLRGRVEAKESPVRQRPSVSLSSWRNTTW